MNDRAAMPTRHGISVGRAMLCVTCDLLFDCSWEECPTCHSGASVMRAPIKTIGALRKDTEGAVQPAPSSNTNTENF